MDSGDSGKDRQENLRELRNVIASEYAEWHDCGLFDVVAKSILDGPALLRPVPTTKEERKLL